ncbi:MAG: AbrB/MazE/SpoVT family DNA-binding domain-containing protein [Rhodobacteraceae bacterium]|nr:AbrB/MazE/SpoVT family DNA-binding domain-containing protein [Paracoccaceae bacterium]MCY4137292.1 AbrB/MazE/SpoVT family DNA-binding domain-containing protein [Paracoccaceae bacterium]
MPKPEMLTTTVSTNGQVILPRSVRRALLWEAGTRLVVEIAPEGVMLRQAPEFFETRSGDVFGCLAFDGRPSLWRRWKQAGVLATAGRRQSGD